MLTKPARLSLRWTLRALSAKPGNHERLILQMTPVTFFIVIS